jgi:hypothetical protein
MKDDQPTGREILESVLRTQDVLAGAIGRLELRMDTEFGVLKADVGTLKADVGVLKVDFQRFERRLIRLDDRLAVIEDARPVAALADHERRISRLEGFADLGPH